MQNIKFNHHSDLSREKKPQIIEVMREVHDIAYGKPMKQESYDWLFGQPELVVLIAYDGRKPVGYKVGYQHPDDSKAFFSFVGGTDPDYRKQGIASRLMRMQHDIATRIGKVAVETKSRPRWAEMVSLNYKFGFRLVREYIGQSCGTTKYLFRKELI